MSSDKSSEDPFVAEVRRQAERTKTSRDAPFWRRFASVGAIGWMVSLPAVLGRWQDGGSTCNSSPESSGRCRSCWPA